MKHSSEIDNLYRAVAQTGYSYYGRNYLNTSQHLPRNADMKRALLDFTEIGRILKREFSLIGRMRYDCSVIDIEILRGGLFGDFELCILNDFDFPFQGLTKGSPEKKNIMKRISIIVDNYLTVLEPPKDIGAIEISDYEDQRQINAAKKECCDYIITSDSHLLQLTEKKPFGITPEAFAKKCGISLRGWEHILKFTNEQIESVRHYTPYLTIADLVGADIKSIAFSY